MLVNIPLIFYPLGIFFVATTLAFPTDEIRNFEEELRINHENNYLMQIVPSGYSSKKLQNQRETQLSDLVDEDNDHYKLFKMYIDSGITMKGLTFNIYDDKMREAAIALFHLLRDIGNDNFHKVKVWAKHNINNHMFEYAWRLVSLYNNKFDNEEIEPPFVMKPNYFVNGETIVKALKLKTNNVFNHQEAKVNQIFRTDNLISINTNYSYWNLAQDDCDENINYFREDISLNSYYFGVHLLHPFWMSNDDLEEINPRHAEYYYFTHQQLIARYLLEKETFKYRKTASGCPLPFEYHPYLIYENGLPFPIRSNLKTDSNTEYKLKIIATDTAIKECIARGIIIMDNGTTINMTEDNYIDLLLKLVRANFDGIKTAKILRSLLGYGRNGYPVDQYNPAPSLLHHPETSLRDPAYWVLTRQILNYFENFIVSVKPYELSDYETEEFNILDSNFSKITTYFDYYQFNINKALDDNNYEYKTSKLVLTARQKRLKHLPFTFNFTIESENDKNAIVRLFIGPQCYYEDCWGNYSRFYQLDAFNFPLEEGMNTLSWSTEKSSRFSCDEIYNMEVPSAEECKYNIYKFPENLLIPKGMEEGLNLTLFIMITPVEDVSQKDFDPNYNTYRQVSYEVDKKPLGFPFHRQAKGYSLIASNYRFYPITVFHNKGHVEGSGYFSAHLY